MKAKTVFYCTECGNETAKWAGRGPACGAWNSIVEQAALKASAAGKGRTKALARSKAHPIAELQTEQELRFSTGMGELDRVLGGGAVKGSLVLVGGAPGIGKSTLMLQICSQLCRFAKVLYVSGEESPHQLKMRAERLEYNVKKQGANRVTVMNMDARQLDDLFAFDRVLLDAPCSGSGTVTEGSRGQFSREYLDRTVKMQKTLLDKAIRLLKPGHEMVYSTCSVLREENEDVVAAALKKGGVELVPIDTGAFEGVPLLPTKLEGVMCVCPDEWYEGFFVAKLRKKAKK